MKKMKRICAILLVFCMIMSLAMVPALAENEPVVFDALDDVKSFYDNDLNDTGSKLGVQNIEEGVTTGNLMLRPCGEWVTYDISALTEGTYSVEIEYYTNGIYADRTGLDFAVDGELEVRYYITTNSGGWSTSATATAGKIYIPADGAQELKVKNSGSTNISLKTVTLTYVGSDDTTEGILIYGINTTGTPNDANTGADVKSGTDFYDAAGTTTFTSVIQYDAVVQHANDWTRYDISDFKAGTYKVTLNRGQSTNVTTYTLNIDGKNKLISNQIVDDDSSYTDFEDVELGEIYIAEGSKYLKLINNGTGAAYVRSLNFEYISSERPLVNFKGAGVISGGQDVGYHDTDSAGQLEKHSDGTPVLRQNEWLKYDVSGLDAGTYEVTLNRGQMNPSEVILSVDNKRSLVTPVTSTTTSYTDYQDVVLGKIYIPEGSEHLTITNNSTGVAYLYSITLRYVSSERPAVNIDGTDVISGGQDVGYHDADSAGQLEKNGTIVTLRKDEWLKYDVSGLDAGTYELKINNATSSTPIIRVDADDSISVVKTAAKTGDNYSNYQDYSFGKIYIGEDTQTIKITNVSGTTLTMMVAAIILEYKTEEDTAEMSININPQNELSYGGNAREEGGYVILREGDSASYDLSSYGLNPGIYSVRALLNSQAATALGVEAEGTEKLRSTPIAGATQDTDEVEIGKLIIGENSTYFTVSLIHTNRVLLYNLRITDAVEEETTFKYTSDAEGKNIITNLDGLTEAYVTVSLIRPEKAFIGETVYVALYESDAQENKRLVKAEPYPVEDGFEFTHTFKITGIGANSTIKTFVWDTDTYTPVTAPAVIVVDSPV